LWPSILRGSLALAPQDDGLIAPHTTRLASAQNGPILGGPFTTAIYAQNDSEFTAALL
jgi:hypothetical protein